MTSFEVVEVPVDKIRLHDVFKFRVGEDPELEKLAESIREVGLVHPPTVRPVGEDFELFAGSRRFRAVSEILKWEKCPVRVIQMDDVQAMGIALAENSSRKDLTPIEEAKAFKSAVGMGMKAVEIAGKIGKSEPYVSNRIKLLTLAPVVVKAIDQGKITPGHAEHGFFLLEEHKDLQEALLKQVIQVGETAQDAKSSAKSMLHEVEEIEKFEAAVKEAKFPKCPRCGTRATQFDWGSTKAFKCQKQGCMAPGSTWDHTEWSPKTGKILNEVKNSGIKAAQEARAKMEAPRTAYWDITVEKARQQGYKKAMDLLKKAITGKDSIMVSVGHERIDVTAPGDYYNKVEFALRDLSFQFVPLPGKKFMKSVIPFGEPTKKKYQKIAELMDYPAQLRHNGKPVKEGPGKVLSSKPGKKKHGVSGLITEKALEAAADEAAKTEGGVHE